MRRLPAILLASALTLSVQMAQAVQPDEILPDPALEARARDISRDLRCLVCQNQSIDDSNADLARDMRILVRERLVAGDSDRQIREFLVARYGEFVLLNPPVNPGTYLLWATPPLTLLLGAGILLVWFRGRRRTGDVANQPVALSPDDEARIRALLAQDGNEGGRP